MAFRLVYTSFWDDPKVIEEMTPEDKYFYLYLLTNTNTNMIGIYEITKKQMAFQLGYSIEAVNSLIDRFAKHYKLIEYDAEKREIFIKNYAKYNLNKGGRPVECCIEKELEKVKNTRWIKEMVKLVPNEKISEIINTHLNNHDTYDDTYHDTYDDTGGNQNQNQNQNQNHISISKDILVPKHLVPVQEKWNSLGLSKIRDIKGNRLKLLNARIKEYGIEQVLEAIENINYSPFLKGQNKTGWVIVFDWFIKPNNFVKVLEGNYKDKDSANGNYTSNNKKRLNKSSERAGMSSAEIEESLINNF